MKKINLKKYPISLWLKIAALFVAVLIFLYSIILACATTAKKQRNDPSNLNAVVAIASKTGTVDNKYHAIPEAKGSSTVASDEAVVSEITGPVETFKEESLSQDSSEKSSDLSSIEQIINDMTLEEKIYQLFIVDPETLVDNQVSCVVSSGKATQNALQEKPVGGIIYFAQNLEDADQTSQMISNVQEYAQSNHGIGLWIAVDEEGGDVARVSSRLNTTQYNSMEYYGARGDTDEVYNVGTGIAADISQFGFNLDFAPVADVNLNSGNELGNRIFSSDPQVVADMIGAVVRGLQGNGNVSATLKHFPGLGAENGNTHYDSQAVIDRTYDQLQNQEFLPFQSGIDAGVDFVMVGHQTMTAAGDNLPSDLSSVVITDWLRNELGFNGIVITDSQKMNTITNNYSSGQAAVKSILAGADIILMPKNLNAAFDGVYQAVQNGQISEERIDESLYRILNKKESHGLLNN
ncbi:glycoside hydrolase family 3 protein [Ruminococcus sp.]|uniref:glycoside hydrolase family 3 protein n=1 Tax=Ruminococcus sp. TaxID=41978 RepID=UPI0025DE0AA2|nr:glycoside hydrolase family 3 protein [Ruminococcus sp.]